MKLIIGGAYQGKQQFAYDQFQLNKGDFLDGRTCDYEELSGAKGMHHIQDFIKRFLLEVENPIECLLQHWNETTDVILICNEMGCGLVPMVATDRKYRELVGRIQCELAKRADEVYRVYCGIGVKIK